MTSSADDCEKYSFERSSNTIWGFSELSLDISAFDSGSIGICAANGVFPDGTEFFIPTDEISPPAAIAADPTSPAGVIVLCLHAPGRMTENQSSTSTLRSIGRQLGAGSSFKLAYEREGLHVPREESLTYMPVLRVTGLTSAGKVLIDDSFIPPALTVKGSEQLSAHLDYIREVVNLRADTLAGRISKLSGSSFGEALLLQTLNRFAVELDQIKSQPDLTPVNFYRTLALFVGELSIFSARRGRRPPIGIGAAFKPDDLQACFGQILAEFEPLRELGGRPYASQLQLKVRARGLYTFTMSDKHFVSSGELVFAFNAIHQNLAMILGGVTLAPAEKIRDIVVSRGCGVHLEPCANHPEGLPFREGWSYCVASQKSDHWKELCARDGEVRVLAVHLGGEQPEFEIWYLTPDSLASATGRTVCTG